MKADIARYEIVLREGGLYVDTDFEPLRPFDDTISNVDLLVGEEAPGILANGLFAAKPGHPFLQFVVDQLPASCRGLPSAPPNERTGPGLFNRCFERWYPDDKPGVRILRRDEVYPYSYLQPHLRDRRFPSALAVHHWAKSWMPEEANRRRKLVGKSVLRQVALNAKRFSTRLTDRWALLGSPRPRHPRSHTSMYIGNDRILTNTAAGFPVLSFASDLRVTPSLATRGIGDARYAAFLESSLRPGDVFVDVGAGIGLWTLAAAWQLSHAGEVLAFEPNPRTNELLQDSVQMNRNLGMLASVTVSGAAISDQPGRAKLIAPKADTARGRINESQDIPSEPSCVFEVDSVTLDDQLGKLAEVRLIRIDVPGNELTILRSAGRTLRSGRVRLLDIPLTASQCGGDWSDLVAEMRTLIDDTSADLYALREDGTLERTLFDTALHDREVHQIVLRFPVKTFQS